MKISPLVCSCLFFTIFPTFSQEPSPPVGTKTLTEKEVTYEEDKNGGVLEEHTTTIFQYDSTGLLIRTEEIFPQDHSIIEHFYNENRRLERVVITYPSQSSQREEYRYIYTTDSLLRTTEMKEYTSKGLNMVTTEWSDEKGHLVRIQRKQMESGFVTTEWITYDEQGRENCRSVYYGNELQFDEQTFYSSNGRVKQRLISGVEDWYSGKYTLFYEQSDDHGNWLVQKEYKNNKPLSVLQRELLYYK